MASYIDRRYNPLIAMGASKWRKFCDISQKLPEDQNALMKNFETAVQERLGAPLAWAQVS